MTIYQFFLQFETGGLGGPKRSTNAEKDSLCRQAREPDSDEDWGSRGFKIGQGATPENRKCTQKKDL